MTTTTTRTLAGMAVTWLGAIPLGLGALGLQRIGRYEASRRVMWGSATLGDVGAALVEQPGGFRAAIRAEQP